MQEPESTFLPQGQCDPRFARVEAAFTQGFTSSREVGAALAVWQDGECVINLWGGHTTRPRGPTPRTRSVPWQQNTLCCFFSVSKAITATCVLQAVDEGLLDLETPVAYYWPEFAAANKEHITIRHLLSHQAGLPGLHAPIERSVLYEWQAMCTALAAETPWWQPGTAHGYHARSFGFLLGEVLHRSSGKTVGEWLADRITTPLGLDVHIGLSEADQTRCADMLPARLKPGEQKKLSPAMQSMLKDFTDKQTPTGAAFQNPSLGPGYMNSEKFRTAQLPAMNGHGTARDVARLMAEVPNLLSEILFQKAVATVSRGPDRVLKARTHFGLGYMLYEEESPIGWPGCFGHAGAGGSVAFCDPQKKLGFAFVMNQMEQGVVSGGTTATACVQALQECLG